MGGAGATSGNGARRLLGIARKSLVLITFISNVLAAVALWACCYTTTVEPEIHPRLSLVGLVFPFILLANLAFIPIWMIVKLKRCWIPIVLILPVIGYVLDYCPVNVQREVPSDCIKLLTWNSDNYGRELGDRDSARNLTREYIRNCDADIICLQESNIGAKITQPLYDYTDSAGYERATYLGMVLLTRFHIINSDTIHYESYVQGTRSHNGSMWFELEYFGDTILLVMNHLESFRLDHESRQEYNDMLESIEDMGYENIKQTGLFLSDKMIQSEALRGPQTDSLCAFIDRHKGRPILMCGDFNDTPISFTYQQISKRLKNAYRESGRGVGISYNQKGFWVRIDHLFVSSHWQTYKTYIDKSIDVSDHYPLVSWLKMD